MCRIADPAIVVVHAHTINARKVGTIPPLRHCVLFILVAGSAGG